MLGLATGLRCGRCGSRFRTDRQLPEVALEAARLFNASDVGPSFAAEAVEAALRGSPTDWDESVQLLLDEYARTQVSGAARAPRASRGVAESCTADRARTRGVAAHCRVICLRLQLWGKAKAYLLESLAAARDASTLLALARLADAIGDEREAAVYFKGGRGRVCEEHVRRSSRDRSGRAVVIG